MHSKFKVSRPFVQKAFRLYEEHLHILEHLENQENITDYVIQLIERDIGDDKIRDNNTVNTNSNNDTVVKLNNNDNVKVRDNVKVNTNTAMNIPKIDGLPF